MGMTEELREALRALVEDGSIIHKGYREVTLAEITGADYYRAASTDDDAPVGPFDEVELRTDGGANLKQYWVHGAGLKKWATKPHPWTALYHHILKHVGNPEKAKRIASQWYHDHFHHWPGERKGKNPVGKG